MFNSVDFPFLVFAISIAVLTVSAWAGASVFRHHRRLHGESLEDFSVVLTAALTLLGLIIGFSFSMAISRYDQRKNLEEAEANAIGTEYVRADLLPAADAASVRTLLRSYLDQRVLYYRTRDRRELPQINARTAKLQSELWSAVQAPATAAPNPVLALVLSGMNDVLNSQGYTQAAWWNRIPNAAWSLMIVIAILCNAMIGYRGGNLRARSLRLLVMPLVVSISLFFIADIDSPRGGFVRVVPQNLLSLADSFR
jgi:hypothetical protein